ncbi:ephrin receptor 1-like [Actinia tenebrosa]|uniref:Ephrin receptor 1-like n=1 Tax=Actinia tenebrosa TaxID=6105 RepID=A0A6P8J322_ACTTE|nr:ephrin receptor 1-like [Actinia tenebrosa]
MVVIGLFDHQGDNNRTSFADIDAVKCCMVDTPDCVTQADCNINADCVTTNTVMKCSCKTGFYGNGKVCKSVVPPTSTTESPITKKQNATTDIPVNPSTPTTTYINPGVDTSGNGLGFSTSSSISNRRQQNSQSVILITVTVVGILVAVLLGVLVWRVRRAKKARLRVQGSNTAKPDQAEMTPFNDIKIINNDNPAQDQQVTSSHLAVVGEEDDSSRAPNNPHQNDNSKAKVSCRPRSATVLSAEHAYMSEEDLDSKCVAREPFYFVLDKNACQKTYSIHRSLALPEPMYGVLEPETQTSPEEPGAQFWKPADTEEELYQQLSREIKRDQIELGTERLGSGAFGHVLLGVWQKSPGIPIQVAVKMLRDSSHRENKIKFLQEAAIMRQFTHKNVVYMYGIAANSEPVMIVLEYMSLGNLKNYLRRLDNKYGENILLQEDTKSQFLRMARDIAAGMQYLHSLAFVHRDLAARNILLDSDMTCKIGDFGMSRDLVEGDYYTSRGGRIPVKWTAPEAINYGKYSSSSDVWSYGIVLYEIWSLGHKPYENLDNNEVIEAVSRGYRLPPSLHCPSMLYRLMVDCWHPESQYRPRSYQIYHCLCFSHQSVFLDDSLCIKQRSQSEGPSVDTPTYMDLKYVYAVTE